MSKPEQPAAHDRPLILPIRPDVAAEITPKRGGRSARPEIEGRGELGPQDSGQPIAENRRENRARADSGKILATDADADRKGANAIIADELAIIRKMRQEQARMAPRPPGRRPVAMSMKSLSSSKGTQHIYRIAATEDARIAAPLPLLRRIVANGATIKLERSAIALASQQPVPAATLAEIINSASAIRDLLDCYRHRSCPGGVPSIIAGARWAIRCSKCKKPLRRRLAVQSPKQFLTTITTKEPR